MSFMSRRISAPWHKKRCLSCHHIIGKGKFCVDAAKIKVMIEWEPPKKVNELLPLCGLVNYYRWFIKGCSTITALLTNLLKKERGWIWSQ